MAAPPLTAVWDPHTELLGGQRQPRAGHQQRSPSPHTLSSPPNSHSNPVTHPPNPSTSILTP